MKKEKKKVCIQNVPSRNKRKTKFPGKWLRFWGRTTPIKQPGGSKFAKVLEMSVYTSGEGSRARSFNLFLDQFLRLRCAAWQRGSDGFILVDETEERVIDNDHLGKESGVVPYWKLET